MGSVEEKTDASVRAHANALACSSTSFEPHLCISVMKTFFYRSMGHREFNAAIAFARELPFNLKISTTSLKLPRPKRQKGLLSKPDEDIAILLSTCYKEDDVYCTLSHTMTISRQRHLAFLIFGPFSTIKSHFPFLFLQKKR